MSNMLIVEHMPFTDAWPLIKDMTTDHFDDVSLAKGKLTLDVDVEFYKLLEKAGKLEAMVIREMLHGEVVGYCCFITNSSHHRYRGKTYAANDVLFIKPEFRQGMNGVRVLKNINYYLKQRYDIITWHVKDKYDFSKILERDDFVKQETVYAYFGE